MRKVSRRDMKGKLNNQFCCDVKTLGHICPQQAEDLQLCKKREGHHQHMPAWYDTGVVQSGDQVHPMAPGGKTWKPRPSKHQVRFSSMLRLQVLGP